MAASMQYTCDHCGKSKGSANHWFLLNVAGLCIQIRPWSGLMSPDAAGARHICGEGCLTAEISAAIAHGKGERFLLREAPEQVNVEEVGAR